VWNGSGTYLWKVSDAGTGQATSQVLTPQTGGTPATFDQLTMGTLTVGSSGTPISKGAGTAFTVRTTSLTGDQITPTAVTGFDATLNYSWVIGTVTSITVNGATLSTDTNTDTVLATGVNSDAFALDTSGMNLGTVGNAIPTGGFFELDAIGTGSGDNLVLSYNYSAAPEPGTAILVLAGGLPMLTARRRRRNREKTAQ
jgi:hypothetical protein